MPPALHARRAGRAFVLPIRPSRSSPPCLCASTPRRSLGESRGRGCSSTSFSTTFRSVLAARAPPPGSRSQPSPTPSTELWSSMDLPRLVLPRPRYLHQRATPSSPFRCDASPRRLDLAAMHRYAPTTMETGQEHVRGMQGTFRAASTPFRRVQQERVAPAPTRRRPRSPGSNLLAAVTRRRSSEWRLRSSVMYPPRWRALCRDELAERRRRLATPSPS